MTNSSQDLLTDILQIDVRYSTFWQRFLATFIDGLVLIPFVIIDTYDKITWKDYTVLIVSFLITLTYKPFMESKYGATLGKMALGLTVTNSEYQKADVKNIILRNIFDIVTRLLLGAVTIITFSNPMFAEANTVAEYNKLAREVGSFLITSLTTILFIIDAIFLIADRQRRALHDRIGQTYVIQKER